MAMHEFVTTAVIRARREVVWDVLTTSAKYGDWNPEIVSVDGLMAAGARLKMRVKVGSGAIRPVTLQVTAFDPPARMEWTGGLPLGLFTGRRILSLTPVDGQVEFRMVVQMSGPLAGLMVKAVGDRQAEIDSFSAALKRRVEDAS